MRYLAYVARRVAFAVLSAYLVVTVAFGLINLTAWQQLRDRLALARYGGASEEEIAELRETYLAERGLDSKFFDRYVDWLVDVTTFEWGYATTYRTSVVDVLDGRVPTTLEYVVPGVLLAVALGVVVGLFAALGKDRAFDWSSRVLAYGLLGVPAFMVVIYYTFLSGTGLSLGGFRLVAPRVHPQVLAAVTVATSLLAGQLRFSRTAALEQSGRAFVKMLRAKGAGRLVLARHVLRNAALPILSLSISELLAVLMLDIYVVEEVLGIDGLAVASLRAVRENDIPLVIWTTMVLVFVGITGNLLQDVLYGYLDPRVRAE